MSIQIEGLPHGQDNSTFVSGVQAFKGKVMCTLFPDGREGQEQLVDLTERVVKKLFTDVREHGTVSLFQEKGDEKFTSSIFTVYLRSPRIPRLLVMLWDKTKQPSQETLEFEQKHFGVTGHRTLVEAIEFAPSKRDRAIAVVRRWNMESDSYEIVYRRSADKESSNTAIPRSNREKIEFLREILDTKVDVGETERHFGRPYVKGDSNSAAEGHIKLWVRDLEEKFQGNLLGMGNEIFQK